MYGGPVVQGTACCCPVTCSDCEHDWCALVQAVAHAFNDTMDTLTQAMQQTARSAAASTGHPAPELGPSIEAAAPACWHHTAVEAATIAMQSARISAAQAADAGAGAHASASFMHRWFNRWAATFTGPRSCLVLQELLPRATPSMLPPAAASASGAQLTAAPISSLARSPGGFAVGPSHTHMLGFHSTEAAPSTHLPGTPYPHATLAALRAGAPLTNAGSPHEHALGLPQGVFHSPMLPQHHSPAHGYHTPAAHTNGVAGMQHYGESPADVQQVVQQHEEVAASKARAQEVLAQLQQLVPK